MDILGQHSTSRRADQFLKGPRSRRLLPAAGLLVMAPFCAEYLIGHISIRDLLLLPFLIPLYGAAALLIREVSRRTDRGWPTMLLLGTAFGVFQAGLVDASLFNREYAGMELTGAEVPVLNFSAIYGLAFVLNHTTLSIGSPIALIEAVAPNGEATPWLGRAGLIVTAVCYLGGSLLIGWDNRVQEGFYPGPLQITAAIVTIAVLITAAFALPRRSPPVSGGPSAPAPLRVGLLAAVMSGGCFLSPGNYAGVALSLVLIAVTTILVIRWSRRPGWDGRHRVALAAGAIVTGAWGAYFVGAFTGHTDLVTRIGNVLFAVIAFGLVSWSAHRSRS